MTKICRKDDGRSQGIDVMARRLLLLVSLLQLSAADVAQARIVERIAAVVNEEIILLSELRARMAPFMAQLQGISDPEARARRTAELQKQALDQMIADKLIKQQARKLKLKVSDKELEKAISEVMRRNNLTREQLKEALQREGKTLSAYKEQLLRPQLLRLKVLNIQVRSRIAISEDEIKAKYNENLRSLGVETKVRARHIFIALLDKDRAQVATKRALAKRLVSELKQGADFAELARKYSDDSVTRGDGGDLGFFSRGTLPPTVEDVVFKMKKGEIRGPLRSSRGLHIIQVTDRKETSALPYKEVREQLRNTLYGEKMEKATQAWLREERKKAHVDVKI